MKKITMTVLCAVLYAAGVYGQSWTIPNEKILPGFDVAVKQNNVLTTSSGNSSLAQALNGKEAENWNSYYNNYASSQLHPNINGTYDNDALIALAGRSRLNNVTWSQHYSKFGLNEEVTGAEAMRISFDIEYVANQTNFNVFIDTQWGGVNEVSVGISSLPLNTSSKTDFLFTLVNLTSSSTIYETEVNSNEYAYEYRSGYIRYVEGDDGKMHVSIVLDEEALALLSPDDELGLIIETRAGDTSPTGWVEYYVIDNLQMEIIPGATIPEASAYASIIGLFAILFAFFRRK
jgi:hypothetical protein